MKLFLDFIYSDNLNEDLLKECIESEKIEGGKKDQSKPSLERLESSAEGLFEYDSPNEKWTLLINRLIRFTIILELEKLEFHLMDCLLNKFFDPDNVLNVLMDSIYNKEDESKESSGLKRKFKLLNVEQCCIHYICKNIKAVIATDKFTLLPRDIIIKIARSVVLN